MSYIYVRHFKLFIRTAGTLLVSTVYGVSNHQSNPNFCSEARTKPKSSSALTSTIYIGIHATVWEVKSSFNSINSLKQCKQYQQCKKCKQCIAQCYLHFWRFLCVRIRYILFSFLCLLLTWFISWFRFVISWLPGSFCCNCS